MLAAPGSPTTPCYVLGRSSDSRLTQRSRSAAPRLTPARHTPARLTTLPMTRSLPHPASLRQVRARPDVLPPLTTHTQPNHEPATTPNAFPPTYKSYPRAGFTVTLMPRAPRASSHSLPPVACGPCPETDSDGAPSQRANVEHAPSGPVPLHLQRQRPPAAIALAAAAQPVAATAHLVRRQHNPRLWLTLVHSEHGRKICD